MASQSSQRSSVLSSTFGIRFDCSRLENLPLGGFISSPTFTAGSYDWAIQYYPESAYMQKVSILLSLRSDVKDIAVRYRIQILDNNGQYHLIPPCDRMDYFENNKELCGIKNLIWSGTYRRKYFPDDVFVILCTIVEVIGPKNCPTTNKTYPGGLCEHMEKLCLKKERFDVTFEVEGESISAHRFMLAARSPVFEAQLFGPMQESKMRRIKINEMNAQAFKALIHFVYTDQLPTHGSNNDHGTLSVELLLDLFVAADRYALDKLVLLCEEQLEGNLSVDMVLSTLLLADRYSRARLKEKCLDFASNPENFARVALTEEYMNIMLKSPSLLAELSEKMKCPSHISKKQRTVFSR